MQKWIVDHIKNFRSPAGLELSNGRVRDGCLYRSGHLGEATDDDLERLRALGIKTVVDLRSDHDIASEGIDRVPDGATHHHIPIEDDAGRGRAIRDVVMSGDLEAARTAFGGGKSLQMATQGAANFVVEPALQRRFASALEIILNPDMWPVLWHCSAGKDRAGWVGTVALLAAGAGHRVIVDHYMESNNASHTASLLPDGEMRDLLLPFVLVQEGYVSAQLAEVENGWASVESMLEEGLGISESVTDRYRSAIIQA